MALQCWTVLRAVGARAHHYVKHAAHHLGRHHVHRAGHWIAHHLVAPTAVRVTVCTLAGLGAMGLPAHSSVGRIFTRLFRARSAARQLCRPPLSRARSAARPALRSRLIQARLAVCPAPSRLIQARLAACPTPIRRIRARLAVCPTPVNLLRAKAMVRWIRRFGWTPVPAA